MVALLSGTIHLFLKMVYITPETVERFKKIFKKEYGVEYSNEEAWEAAHNFLGFFDLLLRLDRKQRKI